MGLPDIAKIIKKVAVKNELSIFAAMRVKNGRGMVCNLHEWDTFDISADDGFYNAYIYAETGALISVGDVKSYPEFAEPDLSKYRPLVVGEKFAAQWQTIKQHAGEDVAKYYMQGVAFFTNGRMVATDGKTLGFAELGTDLAIEESVIVDTTYALRHGEEGKAEKIYFGVTMPEDCVRRGTFTIFEFANGARIYVKDIDGEFPNYQRVIPDYEKEDTFEFLVPGKKEIAKAIKITKLAGKGEPIFLASSANSFAMLNRNGIVPNSVVPLIGCNIVGAQFPWLCINALYLQRVTKYAKAPVIMRGTESQRAIIGKDDNGVTHVVMPMVPPKPEASALASSFDPIVCIGK